eukprot:748389-Hanusia_phi.AAC.1
MKQAGGLPFQHVRVSCQAGLRSAAWERHATLLWRLAVICVPVASGASLSSLPARDTRVWCCLHVNRKLISPIVLLFSCRGRGNLGNFELGNQHHGKFVADLLFSDKG